MARSNKEFFYALTLIEKEKGVPMDYMIEKIKKSIAIACKSNFGGNDDVIVDIDEQRNNFEVFLLKTVVEEVTDKNREISLEEARKINARTGIDEKVRIRLDTKQFGRVAAQTAKNVIKQGIRDGEKEQLMLEFRKNYHEIITTQVERIDDRSGAVILKVGKSTAVLMKNQQIPGESFTVGQFLKVYVADIKTTERGDRADLSRTHPDFIRHLFEIEVPEIKNGDVEIKALSREAGAATKMAVFSNNPNLNAIGACIGSKGIRIANITNEIGNEKIEIVQYSDDPSEFIKNAFSPSKVTKVVIKDEEQRACKAYLPKNQISLAIGPKGQNVRLVSKLTGWRIDVKDELLEGTEEDEDIPESKEPFEISDEKPADTIQNEENTGENEENISTENDISENNDAEADKASVDDTVEISEEVQQEAI